MKRGKDVQNSWENSYFLPKEERFARWWDGYYLCKDNN